MFPIRSKRACDHFAKKLQRALGTVHICVTDVSDGHVKQGFQDGRAENPNGLELVLLAVSERFEGISLRKRHQLVYEALHSDFESGGIHSLQMKTWTESKWKAKGSPTSLREIACTSVLSTS